jgi:hypothetical protein
MDRKEYKRTYRATPNGIKSRIISGWRFNGLIGDYDLIYDKYLKTSHCEQCNVFLEGRGNNRKCMDHDHSTGLFRMVCCSRCNISQLDQKKGKNNTSGYKGVSFHKRDKVWIYRKEIRGIIYKKTNKSKITLLTYKFAYLILINHRIN